MSTFIHLDTISDLVKLFGPDSKPAHPLVAVLDFSKATEHAWDNIKLSASFYVVLSKTYYRNNIKYGHKPVDFQDGSLICMAPNQIIEMDAEEEQPGEMNGWGLFFHPDLIRATSLGNKMKDYSFFSYEISEALHLSEKEKMILNSCMLEIEAELKENIDIHSQSIIVSNIELLLNYCTRFYGRQFITRKSSNHSVVMQIETILSDYFRGNDISEAGLPSVKYLAEKVNLSPGYLSDLLKKETGKNTQDHIHFHLIEEAKSALLGSGKSVNEIAYALGFEYPQYFNKLFKQKTGKTPVEFRNNN